MKSLKTIIVKPFKRFRALQPKIKLTIVAVFLALIIGGSFGASWYFTYERVFDTVESEDGLVIVHHPGRYSRSVNWYSDYYNAYNNTLVGLEVFNQGDRYTNDRYLWDAINRERDPYNFVWGFSNDDYHSITHSFRNYNHILMESLTEEDLKEAMRTGATYFSYEPNGNQQNSTTYGHADTPRIASIELTNNIIYIEGVDYTMINWYNDHTEIIGTGSSWGIPAEDTTFIRAELVNDAGSSFTQPFGIVDGRLYNPYSAVNWSSANQYKANFHTHTTRRGGEMDPGEVINHFHAANYSILAITDHSQNTWRWSNFVDTEPAQQNDRSEYYPALGMLAISGNEVSNSHHYSSLFSTYNGAGTTMPI